jgi:hypothetical protein
MEILSEYFKPENRTKGEEYFRKELVYLSVAADTQVQAFIKAGAGARVQLKSRAISSIEIEADCNCPIYSKGTFCSHIWATLLETQKKHSDFLESKTEMTATAVEESPASLERKAKLSEFKKAQSAKLKERNKQVRLKKKHLKRAASRVRPSYPPLVESALIYFEQNGFPLEDTLNEESIHIAKRKLSRVFHPDKGGSHEEILNLNHHCEVLLKTLA